MLGHNRFFKIFSLIDTVFNGQGKNSLKGNHISIQIKKIAIKLAIYLLRILMELKNLLIFVYQKWLKNILAIINNLFLKLVLINFYKFYLFLKKIIARALAPARNKFTFSLSHRYLVHAVLIVIALLVAVINVGAQGTGESFGEKTLLAALVNPSREEYIEEKTIIQNGGAQVLSYLGQEVAQPANLPLTDIETDDLETDVTALTQGGAAVVKPEIGPGSNLPRTRTGIEEYAVQPGDTISQIAAKFGISVNTVLWANNLSSYSYIRPGEKIKIMPVSGLTHKVVKNDTVIKLAKYYSANEKDVRDWNNLTEDAALTVGQELIIPGGQKPRPAPTYNRTASPNAPANAPAAGGGMIWPVNSRRVTQYFSWLHHGLDIGAPMGTPIYAADNGVIEQVGWGAGYGNQVVINHGNGKKTRYAHASQIYVAKGQTVAKGQAIAAVGSTGWSTGPHLHFEVIIGGVTYNPLNYIK